MTSTNAELKEKLEIEDQFKENELKRREKQLEIEDKYKARDLERRENQLKIEEAYKIKEHERGKELKQLNYNFQIELAKNINANATALNIKLVSCVFLIAIAAYVIDVSMENALVISSVVIGLIVICIAIAKSHQREDN